MSSSVKLAKAMLLNDRPIVIDESDIVAKGFVYSMQVEPVKMDQSLECNINFRSQEFNSHKIISDAEYMIVRIRHG